MKGPRLLGSLFLCFMLVTACAASLNSVRSKNRENLTRLSIGIKKAEILEIMGTETITTESIRAEISPTSRTDKINNPYRTETLKGSDGQIYEVLFYYTDMKKRDGVITDDELTPILIKEGRVVGWGWSFLNENVTKQHYQIDIR